MVEAPQQQDTSYIAPIVFIENVEINKNTYKVFYSISDSDNSWNSYCGPSGMVDSGTA
jgi:hypothetical protein